MCFIQRAGLLTLVAVLSAGGSASGQADTVDQRLAAVTEALYHRTFVRGERLPLYADGIATVVGKHLVGSDMRVRSLQPFLGNPAEACEGRIPRPYVTVDSLVLGDTSALALLRVLKGEESWSEEYRLVEEFYPTAERPWRVAEVLLFDWYQEFLVPLPAECKWHQARAEEVGGR